MQASASPVTPSFSLQRARSPHRIGSLTPRNPRMQASKGPVCPAPNQRKHSHYSQRRAVTACHSGGWPARSQAEVKEKVTRFFLLKQHHKGEREVSQIPEPAPWVRTAAAETRGTSMTKGKWRLAPRAARTGTPVMKAVGGNGRSCKLPQLPSSPAHGRLHSGAWPLFSGPSVQQRTLHSGRRSGRKVYLDSCSLRSAG